MKAIPDYVLKALEQMQREAEQREDAAFARGWQAAQRAISEAAAQVRGPGAGIDNMSGDVEEAAAQPVNELLAAQTNRHRVRVALKQRPGMRPIEVYGYLAQMGLNVNRDSVLTIIKRMRSSEEIRNEGTGLYLVEKETVA